MFKFLRSVGIRLLIMVVLVGVVSAYKLYKHVELQHQKDAAHNEMKGRLFSILPLWYITMSDIVCVS